MIRAQRLCGIVYFVLVFFVGSPGHHGKVRIFCHPAATNSLQFSFRTRAHFRPERICLILLFGPNKAPWLVSAKHPLFTPSKAPLVWPQQSIHFFWP